MKKLILASASPRRRELLEQIGLEPEVLNAHTDEKTDITQPGRMVEELAERKCLAAAGFLNKNAADRKEYYVLGADTVVVCDGKILGKPKDPEDAVNMLRSLQGKKHQVHTGVCVLRICRDHGEIQNDPEQKRLFSVCTEVRVNSMSDDEIRLYVNTGEPMDKAGAYGIQGQFARHIGSIQGEYANVVGLPVSSVYTALRELHFYE